MKPIKLGKIDRSSLDMSNDILAKETMPAFTISSIKQEPDPSPPIEPKSEIKTVAIMVALLIGVFILAIVGFNWYNQATQAKIVDVDELHRLNLEGKLNPEEGYMYDGFSFVKADYFWWTEIKQPDRALKIPLRFGPREVENVTIEGKLDPKFNFGEDVYMGIDPYFADKYYTIALSELNNNLATGIRRRPVAACTKGNDDLCQDRPILNCTSTKGLPLIELQYQEGETGKIALKGTCILITGQDFDLVRAADRLIWQWYGIMK